jgi:hypothetical protein
MHPLHQAIPRLFAMAAFLTMALAQVKAVPAQGPSVLCYRHEPATRVLCRVEVPPGGPLALDSTNTFYNFYRESERILVQRSAFARAFYLTFPLDKQARAFERVNLQQRSRNQAIWVEFSVAPSATSLYAVKLGPFEVKEVPLNLVLPTSYQAPMGDRGDFAYLDETGFQLIDGDRGIAPYRASKDGNPPSYEWVGWRNKKVVLQFTLPSWTAETPLRRISIGTFRGSGSIELPKRISVFDNRSSGAAFEVDPGVYPPETPIFLELEGLFYGPYIMIELEPKDWWIFVDEVRFSLQ